MTRENEIWSPPVIWPGETAFVLASGPSMTTAAAEKVRGRHTIVVNSTAALAPWADVLFFTDSGWYEPRRELVRKWAGLVVSMSRTAKREMPDKVNRVHGWGDPTLAMGEFPAPGSSHIRQGRSSGHSAVSLAIAFGAATIVLLGFDMRVVSGREHHHAEYTNGRDLDVYARDFVPGFDGWNVAAAAAGVTILNATPGSAVTEFPMVDLDEVLR